MKRFITVYQLVWNHLHLLIFSVSSSEERLSLRFESKTMDSNDSTIIHFLQDDKNVDSVRRFFLF